MKGSLLKLLSPVVIVLLLSVLPRHLSVSSAADNTPTPAPGSAPVVLTFAQSALADRGNTAFAFTVREDGTVRLALVSKSTNPDDAPILWQQQGTITQDQVAKVKTNLPMLKQMTDLCVPSLQGQDFLLIAPQGIRVEVACLFQHVDPNNEPQLKELIQTLESLRQPFVPLLNFRVTEGDSKDFTQLTFLNDGSGVSAQQDSSNAFFVSESDFSQIKSLIAQTAAMEMPPMTPAACTSQCFEYDLVFFDSTGNLKHIHTSLVELEVAPPAIQKLVAMLLQVQTGGYSHMIKSGGADHAIGTLDHGDVLIGAFRLLELQPNTAPSECVVLKMQGPMSYDLTGFDGFWFQIESNPTADRINQLMAAATKTVAAACGADKVKTVQIP
jgi:hypothetical protein